jgi:hypothetical protein
VIERCKVDGAARNAVAIATTRIVRTDHLRTERHTLDAALLRGARDKPVRDDSLSVLIAAARINDQFVCRHRCT